jgi:hypothetical protein
MTRGTHGKVANRRLKDAHMFVRVFGKLALISSLEEYLCYLVNIASYSIKQDLPLHTNYSMLYSLPRMNERECNCLAGYNGFGPVMIGQPFFYCPLDEINPIGSVLLSLTYIFYDARLSKLEKQANFDYI